MTDNNPGVWACLRYEDADAARVFMTEVLGFTETVTFRDVGESGAGVSGAEGSSAGVSGADKSSAGESTGKNSTGKTRIVHAEVKWPEGGGIMYGSGGTHEDYPQPVPGTQWIYVVTADVDGVYKRVVAAGGKVVAEPTETDYGSRNVTVADPEGNIWTFGTYPGA